LSAQVALLVVAFVVPTLIARAVGARWGVAGTFGQIAFLAAVTAIILAAPRPQR
jgi:hypothetical protein